MSDLSISISQGFSGGKAALLNMLLLILTVVVIALTALEFTKAYRETGASVFTATAAAIFTTLATTAMSIVCFGAAYLAALVSL